MRIETFRGKRDERPFQAGTASGIHYYSSLNPWNGKTTLIVESRFSCQRSYFKPSDADRAVLAHEQLHFDITEVYARKFRKRIQDRSPPLTGPLSSTRKNV